MWFSDWRSFELLKSHCFYSWTLLPQKDQRKLDSLRYNSFKEIPYVIFLSCGSFYVTLVNQTVIALGLFSWRPVSQIQPSIIFIAFRLKLMKLLCDQRRVQHSVVVFGAELEVKSIVESGTPFLIVSNLIISKERLMVKNKPSRKSDREVSWTDAAHFIITSSYNEIKLSAEISENCNWSSICRTKIEVYTVLSFFLIFCILVMDRWME